MINQIFFMAACGRSGSLLTHVLLQSNPNVVIPEGLGMFKDLKDPTHVNSSILTQFCKSSIKETNLWSLEPREIPDNYLDPQRSHENCGCSRLMNKDSRIVIHLHNLLYDCDDFERFIKFQLTESPNFVTPFLLPIRTSWLANLSSRCKATSFNGLPRIALIIYWCSIERQAWRARYWIENNFPCFKLPIECWHSDGIEQWHGLHDFLGLKRIQFPDQLVISGNKWTGGIKTDKFVHPDQEEKLFQVHLSKFESWIAKCFEPGMNQSSNLRQLVASTLSVITNSLVWIAFYALVATRKVLVQLKNRYHEKTPIYVGQTFSIVTNALSWPVLQTRIQNLYEALAQYEFARRKVREWSNLLKNL